MRAPDGANKHLWTLARWETGKKVWVFKTSWNGNSPCNVFQKTCAFKGYFLWFMLRKIIKRLIVCLRHLQCCIFALHVSDLWLGIFLWFEVWFVAWRTWNYILIWKPTLSPMLCVSMLCKWFVSKKMWVGYQLSDSHPTSVTDMAPKVHIDNTHSCRHARTHKYTHVRQYDRKRYLKHVTR